MLTGTDVLLTVAAILVLMAFMAAYLDYDDAKRRRR